MVASTGFRAKLPAMTGIPASEHFEKHREKKSTIPILAGLKRRRLEKILIHHSNLKQFRPNFQILPLRTTQNTSKMSCCRSSCCQPCKPVCCPPRCQPTSCCVSVPAKPCNPYAICAPLYPCDGCCVPVKPCGAFCQPFATPGSKHASKCDNEKSRNKKYPKVCVPKFASCC